MSAMQPSRRTVGRVWLIAFLLVIFACSCASNTSYKNGIFKNDYNSYLAPVPGKGWKRISAKDADLAFWNDNLSAFIMVNSTCGSYRDAPISALANHLFFGIEDKEFVLQEERKLDGRDALYSIVTGKLDGASVKIAAYTLSKNYCTYDLTYSAPAKAWDNGIDSLHKLAKRFKVLRRD